ncbi:MAG: hypothetical protein AB9836_04410 [Aminipila sp.]
MSLKKKVFMNGNIPAIDADFLNNLQDEVIRVAGQADSPNASITAISEATRVLLGLSADNANVDKAVYSLGARLSSVVAQIDLEFPKLSPGEYLLSTTGAVSSHIKKILTSTGIIPNPNPTIDMSSKDESTGSQSSSKTIIPLRYFILNSLSAGNKIRCVYDMSFSGASVNGDYTSFSGALKIYAGGSVISISTPSPNTSRGSNLIFDLSMPSNIRDYDDVLAFFEFTASGGRAGGYSHFITATLKSIQVV